MAGFEEDLPEFESNENEEFENNQSLRPGKNLNSDSSLNPSHPFAKSEQSSFPKAQFTSIGGTSLLMRAALNYRQNRESSLISTENIISQKNSNKTQEKEEDKENPIIQALNYIWGTVIGDWNNEQDPIQILANVGVGLIPVADQVLDFRDFIAHLYYMVFKKDYKDPMRWLALGLTAIGAIPFVGSILKGLGKISIFSDGSKAIGKYAEPILEQIKQINPEWGDVSKLKVAIDENWEAGVAVSKEAWMNLLANVKVRINGVPLPPGWVWGADKLTSAKQELLSTITEIQNLSNTMLDEALEKIKTEIEIILEQLDLCSRGLLGELELERVGNFSGVRNTDRTRISEPPQKVEPMQISGSSGSGGLINLTEGASFKKHFLSKKKLLGDFLGKKYPKLKTDGPIFLQDIADLINNGTVTFIGQGTLKKGQPPVNIYRGNGLTVITKPNGEWVTLLETGKGMDLGIQMIIP